MIMKKPVSTQYLREGNIYVTIVEVKSPVDYVIKESPSMNTASMHASRFLELEESMQKYYRSVEQGFFQLPVKDTIVVVKHEKKYYRAKVCSILNLPTSYLIKVYLLDYGKDCSVSKDSLYKIHSDFMSVPFQVTDFKLPGLKPMSLVMSPHDLTVDYGTAADWDPSAFIFIEGICKALRNAFVKVEGTAKNCIVGTLHVTLPDGEEKCINNELMFKKFASQVPEYQNNITRLNEILSKENLQSNPNILLRQANNPEVPMSQCSISKSLPTSELSSPESQKSVKSPSTIVCEPLENVQKSNVEKFRELLRARKLQNQALSRSEGKKESPSQSNTEEKSLKQKDMIREREESKAEQLENIKDACNTINEAVQNIGIHSIKREPVTTSKETIKLSNVNKDSPSTSDETILQFTNARKYDPSDCYSPGASICLKFREMVARKRAAARQQNVSLMETESPLNNDPSELVKSEKLPHDPKISATRTESVVSDLPPSASTCTKFVKDETIIHQPSNSVPVQDVRVAESDTSAKSDGDESVGSQASSLEEEISKRANGAKILEFLERSKRRYLSHKKSEQDQDNANLQLATNVKIVEESCRALKSEIGTKLAAMDVKNVIEESCGNNSDTNKSKLADASSSDSHKSMDSQTSTESEKIAKTKKEPRKLKMNFEQNRKDRALLLAQTKSKQNQGNESSQSEVNSSPSIVCMPSETGRVSAVAPERKYMEASCGNDSVADILELVEESSDSNSNSPKSEKYADSETESLSLVQQEPSEPVDFGGKSLFEKQKIPALCLGEGIPTPVLSLSDIAFHPSIRKTLENLNFEGPSCIQSVVWPAALRSRCLAAIAPPHSGKTFAYLLPIVSNFLSGLYFNSSKSNGPRAIIICSSWKKVQHVYDLLQLFLQESKVKILTYFADGRSKRNRVTALMNGCDILISVPSILLNFFKDNSVCVKRCCHFILDDGANLLSNHMNEVKSIMEMFGEAIKLRPTIAGRLQILINSERWTKGVASFVDKFLREPLLLFTSFLEAAIYAKIPMIPHICSESDKNEKIVEILKTCGKRTIICVQDIKKAFDIHYFLQSEHVRSFLVTEKMEHYISNGVVRDWKYVNSGLPYCLIVTDPALTGMNLCDANYIIHYDLPEISRLQFGNRFGCIAEHFQKSKIVDCESHIVISETCAMQAAPIQKIIRRIGMDVPKELNDFVDKQMKVPANPGSPLCRYFKAFGLCKLPHCEKRHHINSAVDQPKVIFREGHVDAKVTHIFDASHFYVRIIKYIPPNCEQSLSLSGEYAELGLKLKNFYSVESNRKIVDCPVIGGNYIIKHENGFFFRVKVMDIVRSPETNSQMITLLFRDDGFVQSHDVCELYEDITCDDLPPPHAAEVFLCNVATTDSCLDWNPQANHFIKKLVMDKAIHGKIVLCLGETLWLQPLVLREKLVFNNDYVNVLSVSNSLRDAEFAFENEDHLPLLYKACANKIQLPNRTSSRPPEKVIHEDLKIQVSYAFLELNVHEDVYISSVISPHQIYVQRLKFVDCLNELLEKINHQVDARKLKKCSALLNGMHCIAPFSLDNRYYRALITNVSSDSDDVHLFFVDFGDSCCARKDSIFILPSEFTLLPFQAIECELDGIRAPHGGYSEKVADFLEDSTRDESNDMKIMKMKAYTKLTSYDAGNRYKVDVWNGEKTLSEQLLAEGLVDPADKFIPFEALNETKEDKEISEDDPDGGSLPSDEELPSENKDHHALFCAALSKMLLQNMTNSEAVNEAVNERRKNKEQKKYKLDVDEISINGNVEEPVKEKFEVLKSPLLALQRVLDYAKKREESKKTRPTIFWWDTSEQVHMLFKLKDIQLYELDVKDDSFMFKTTLRGVDYYIEENFYGAVHSKDCIEKNGPEGLNIILKKQVEEKWPRLIKEKKKLPYIKYDLEHIDVSDSEDVIGVPDRSFEVPQVKRFDEDDDSTDDEKSIPEWKKIAEFKDPYCPMD